MTADRESEAVLTVLGSGTLIPDATRHSASHHLDSGSASVLLDCGPGTVHGLADQGIAWSDLTHIAVTHYHCDHVGDLSPLLFALKHGVEPARTRPLKLLGPPGFAAFLGRVSAALGDHVLEPGFVVEVVEVHPGSVYRDGALTFSCVSTPHTEESIAYRLEGPWGAIGYTGDTGPSDDVAAFLSGCEVVVSECALTDPPSMRFHLSPEGLAGLASVATPDLLIVTHVYPDQSPDEAVRGVERRYEGRVCAGRDGMRVRVRPSSVTVDPPGRPVYT